MNINSCTRTFFFLLLPLIISQPLTFISWPSEEDPTPRLGTHRTELLLNCIWRNSIAPPRLATTVKYHLYIYIYMYRCNGVMNLILRFFPGDVLREERKQVGVSLCDMWELRFTSGANEVVTGAEQSSHIKHDNTSVTGTVFLQNHNFYIWCFKCILFLIINHRILLNWARLSTTPEPPTSCHPHPPTDHLNPPFFTTSPPRSLWSGQLQT